MKTTSVKIRLIREIRVLFLLIFAVIAVGAENPNDALKARWLTNFEQAMQIGSKQGKSILLVFAGSDWCRPCIKLTREVFATETFKIFAAQNLILVEADFPRQKKNRLSEEQMRHNEKLAEKYNPDGEFPLVLLLDARQKVVARLGYEPGGAERFVRKLSRLLSENDRTE